MDKEGEAAYRILPFVGTAPTFVKVEGSGRNSGMVGPGGNSVHIMPVPGPGNGHYHGQMGYGQRASFLERLQVALMSLGSWEGRAVAFVLGAFMLSFVTSMSVGADGSFLVLQVVVSVF